MFFFLTNIFSFEKKSPLHAGHLHEVHRGDGECETQPDATEESRNVGEWRVRSVTIKIYIYLPLGI